jgi:hypothetical protein
MVKILSLIQSSPQPPIKCNNLEVRKRTKEKIRKIPHNEKPKTQPVEDTQKHKHKYPCCICEEENYTKDVPCCVEVDNFIKGTSSAPIVLKNPFPSQQTQMVVQDQPSTSGRYYVLMCQENTEDFFVIT